MTTPPPPAMDPIQADLVLTALRNLNKKIEQDPPSPTVLEFVYDLCKELVERGSYAAHLAHDIGRCFDPATGRLDKAAVIKVLCDFAEDAGR